MTPIALTDEQLDTIFRMAAPLTIDDRSSFLEEVARALGGLPELGDGAVARACAEVQRQFFNPPDLDRNHVPRWSSRRRNGVRAG